MSSCILGNGSAISYPSLFATLAPTCFMVLIIKKLFTNDCSWSVGNCTLVIFSGLTPVSTAPICNFLFTAFLSFILSACDVIDEGTFDIFTPNLAANKSSNASDMFALNMFLCPSSAEFKSALTEPINWFLNDLNNPFNICNPK